MNLGLSEDQLAIEEAFTRLFVKECPPSVPRAAEPLGFDRGLWDRLVDMGAPGMGVADASGGGGATLSDLVVVAETVGRAIAPVPLIEHMVAARVHPVDDVVEGASIATVSLRPARSDGTWRLVPAGAIADVVIGVDGDELVAVRSAAPGHGPRNHAAAPLADRSARAGERTVLGPAAGFARALDEWKTLTAAALVGISVEALQLGRDYAMSRYQFGVPIGSFQAVQHGLADLPALIDGARLLNHKAAWAGDRPTPGMSTTPTSRTFPALPAWRSSSRPRPQPAPRTAASTFTVATASPRSTTFSSTTGERVVGRWSTTTRRESVSAWPTACSVRSQERRNGLHTPTPY
jgi:alkylation response protein AidB-like acyl-CoA dehydrogenase